MSPERALLLALRPRFASAILDGTKTVELRRRPVNAVPDSFVVLYASAPVMAVVGTARLRTVDIVDAATAWARHNHHLGLTRHEFDTYLDGATAHLLHLTQPRRLNHPLPLDELRAGGFQPPQSFRYVAPSDPHQLRALLATT